MRDETLARYTTPDDRVISYLPALQSSEDVQNDKIMEIVNPAALAHPFCDVVLSAFSQETEG